MTYTDVVILIPSHSLEDFPTDQGELPASGLLNAFAVAFHPRFLAGMPQLPRWHRADDPPKAHPGQLVFVPSVCDGWLPHAWVEQAREAGAIVIDSLSDRQEMLDQALAGMEPLEMSPELVKDCLALGTCWLQVELLTRHMRGFGSIDEIRFQNRVIAAAKAVLASDIETAEVHLRAAFEVLLQAREQFFPPDCYLLDLCLVIPDVADDHLLQRLQQSGAINILVTGADLQTIADRRPDVIEALRTGLQEGRVGLVGGELQESSVPLLPMNSWLADLQTGCETFQMILGTIPRIWGRRRFGLAPNWPQMLTQLGYRGALHLALDDGIYPDSEHSRFRWQGDDGAVIDAFSRIPLAADGAATFLRFPVRLAESMDHDAVAAICLARWPEVRAPWMDDLTRIQKYAPVLGKFATFEQIFNAGGAAGKLCKYDSSEYFAPFLLQHVALRDADPISRYADHVLRRRRFDDAAWCRQLAQALWGRPLASAEETALERQIETCGPDRTEAANCPEVEASLQQAEQTWTTELAHVLMGNATTTSPGQLLVNPFRFGRRVTIPWPADARRPTPTGLIRAVDVEQSTGECHVTVDLPGGGFVWLSTETTPQETSPSVRSATLPPLSLGEGWTFANERFEITLNEETGGIAQVRHPQRRENRISQLVSFRFPRERQIPGPGQSEPTTSQYAETVCLGHEVIRTNSTMREVATWGEIRDQLKGTALAKFRQQTRLLRYRPVIEIDIELSDVQTPDLDPWNQYFCVRFAWDNSSAAITRCLVDGAQNVGSDRFTTTEYIEVADESQRLTIIPHGLPFHRKTGARMVDSLLIVAGEQRRKFTFTLSLDQPYPLEAAREATAGLCQVATNRGFPQPVSSGWLFHVDARNVQWLKLLDVADWEADESTASLLQGTTGFAIRLLETEGHRRPVRLRTFRTPIAARKRDLKGKTVSILTLEQDAVVLTMGPHELADIELRFSE